ncbi:ATP-dependent helicase [Nocardioides houyundeii]|uniref:ATP-dependent helicase n=1 Tax=Nocardioides houyundeii TaxID=2045452 RepID=UPI001F53726D|nr:ATP-dependent DNA helicase [Nocardioides houyundeii]
MIVDISGPADLQRVMGTDFQVSDQQWAAIDAPLAPAVVIAGAGSGKTSLMAARVVHLVATGRVAPHEILGLTFTTKAASELRRRVADALREAGLAGGSTSAEEGEEVLEPTVATYNAYASALLTEHGLRIGHEPDTRVLADATRYQLAVRAIQRHVGPVALLSDHPPTVVNYILGLDGAMSEHLVDVAQVREFDARTRAAFEHVSVTERARKPALDAMNVIDRREELLSLVQTYRRLKADHQVMDFSDQISLAARLATERSEVGVEERRKFKMVLLDEYQDTSVAQATMLSRLFSGPDAESGRGHPVMAVGDPNQAIYGWRGASVSNILGFGLDFPRADGAPVPTFPLTVNRRSDRRILAAANELARPLYESLDSVEPLRAPGDAADGGVRLAVHETYADELAWLAAEVQESRNRLVAERPGTPAWREIGVLVRDNAHAADVFDALSAADVPVEIVGLQGLLRLPEVAEVVATLSLLQDLTANAALLTLLNGPRWAVGPRDLALLGRRAEELVGPGTARGGSRADVAEQLADAVAGADPMEIVSLADALDDPGHGPYSAEARERFSALSAELRQLRQHTGEPLLDLVRRIIDTTGIDIELASAVSKAARARRDNLDLFVKAVADFQGVDGHVGLGALLAYLTAEDELGNGLDVATPTEADSVKLLTVHRAKGLEWDVVFCVGVCEEKFPNTRGRTLWTGGPAVLPSPLRGDARDLPTLKGHTKKDLEDFREASRKHAATEELRLGYVAFTRPRHELVVSSHLWTESRKTPLGPSPYQDSIRATMSQWGAEPESWSAKPDPETRNPLLAGVTERPWPVTERTTEAMHRIAAAELVREAMDRRAAPSAPESAELDLLEQARISTWDEELERLLVEARRDGSTALEVALPSSLSATSLSRLRDDPDAFAADLARPMPRAPSPAARFGTRFHAWVESRFGQQGLIDPDELPGRFDSDIDDGFDLQEVITRFEKGPFADRVPHAVEAPFALLLAGQVVRGRIDAIYREPDGSHLLVDWKTGRHEGADPLQLAVYRIAWAELHGLPLERVRAVFHHVRSGRTVEPEGLPDRADLKALVRPGRPPEPR